MNGGAGGRVGTRRAASRAAAGGRQWQAQATRRRRWPHPRTPRLVHRTGGAAALLPAPPPQALCTRTLVAVVVLEAVVGRDVEVVGLQVEACGREGRARVGDRSRDEMVCARCTSPEASTAQLKPRPPQQPLQGQRGSPAGAPRAHRGRAGRARAAACRGRSTPRHRPPRSRAGRCGWGGSRPARRRAERGAAGRGGRQALASRHGSRRIMLHA